MNLSHKIKCLAIDDEPLALQQLTKYINQIPFLELVAECQSATEAKAIIEETVVDAIFTDINMPDLNGMDFVHSLSAPPMVVFTTAYSQYAVEGYKVDAVDYLLKPFNLDDFSSAANKVLQKYELLHPTNNEANNTNEDFIFVKTDYRIIKINLREISHIEGMSEYLRIYLDGSTKPIISLLSLRKMEETLPENIFMRVHRSFIINLNKIKEINKNKIILENSINLPVGDLYRDRLSRYISSKFIER